MWFFREKTKKGQKRPKYLKIWAKMYKIWKYFEKGQFHECDYRMHETSWNMPWFVLKLYIISNSTNSIEFYIIRCLFCYFFVIIFKKVYLVFPTASSNDLIAIDIYALCYTARSHPTTMRRKNNVIHCKETFNPFRRCIVFWGW